MTQEENPNPIPPDDSGAAEERTSPRHRAAVIHRIRTLMEFWNITEDELQRVRPRRVVHVALEIKYRHPISGESWDGQGPQPDWLRQALLREGYTVEELRQAAQVSLQAEENETADPS